MRPPPLAPAAILRDSAQGARLLPSERKCAHPRTRAGENSPPDDDADHVRRRQIFFLDLSPRRGAVFRRQQPAFLGKDHPAIAPPVRQHALIVDAVVALLGGADPRMPLVERIEPRMILFGKQLVAEIVRGVTPNR